MKFLIKKTAVESRAGGKPSTTFKDMENLSQKPLSTLELFDKTIDEPEAQKKIKGFCENLK